MSWLIVLYCGNEIREWELENGRTVTIGSDKNDVVRVDGQGLERSHLTLTDTGSGAHLSAVVPVRIGENETSNRILSPGDIARVTSGVSLAVFERKRGAIDPVTLSGQHEVAIGRSSRNDICLSGGMVSSAHAVLRKKGIRSIQ